MRLARNLHPSTTLFAYTYLSTLCPSTLLSCAEHPRLCHKPTALSTAHAQHMHRPTYPVYATRRPPSISSDLLFSLRAARRPSCYDVTQPTLPYPTRPASRPRLLQLPSSLARRGAKNKTRSSTTYPLPSTLYLQRCLCALELARLGRVCLAGDL